MSNSLFVVVSALLVYWMNHRSLSVRLPSCDSNGELVGTAGVACGIEERRRLEERVRNSERSYRELADAIPQIVFIANAEGGVTQVNAKATEYTGAATHDLTDWSWERFLHPDDVKRTVDRWKKTLQTGQPLDNEFRIRRADGEYRWHITRQIPARNLQGEITHWYGTCTDIEDLRRAQDALGFKQAVLRTLIDSLPDLIFTTDDKGGFQLSNRAHLLHTGMSSEEEIRGKTVFDLYSPESAEAYHADNLRVLEHGESILDREELSRDASGRETRRFVIKVPLRDNAGNITGLVGTSRDIQARWERERALEDRERLLSIVTEAARAGLVVIGDHYEILFANEAYAEILGTQTRQIVGRRLPELVPEVWSEVQPRLDQALAGERVTFEIKRQSLSFPFQSIWLRVIYEPRTTAAGKQTVIAMVVDITERKEAEELLRAERDRFRIIVETVPVVICSFQMRPDGTRCFPYCSPRIESIQGISPEILARDAAPFFSAMNPCDVDRVESSIAESARAMSTWHMQFRMKSPSRGEIWIDGYSTPVLEQDGSIVWHGYITDVTERLKTEEALRESERQLRDAQQIARLGSWGWVPSSGHVWWSEGVFELFKTDRSTTKPSFEAFLSLVHPDDKNIAIQRVEAVLAGADGFADDLRINLADGQIIWIHSQGRVTRDDSGTIVCVEGTDQDITARKCAEEALKANITARKRADKIIGESEERYRRLVEILPSALFILAGGKIVFCNPAFVRLMGAASRDELLGRSPYEVAHPDYHELIRTRMRSMNDTGLPSAGIEMKVMRVDGQVVPVYSISTPLVGAEPSEFLVALSDLTEREQSMQLLRSVLGSVDDAILTINVNGRIKSANPSTERLFGYTESELLGVNVNILMPAPYRDEHDAYISNYLRTGQAKVIGIGREVNGRRKDGVTFPLELTVTEFQFDGERNFTGVVRDITERKRLEAQFQQSQKMEAIGRLAGGVAHDFNNLLTIINGYADLLLADVPAGDRWRESVASILDAGERAARLTHQLLAFSRKAIVEPKVLDLNELIEHSSKMVRRLIGEDIILTVIPDPALAPIKVDVGQLEQVLLNLVVNARDAMPTGGRLTIQTKAVVVISDEPAAQPDFTAGHFAKLSVTDTGCGISEEVQSKIFEPFFTTKGIGKGSGLGLAVVHGIVTQCGGSIKVNSSVGLGTTFHILLPVADASIAMPAVEVSRSAIKGNETLLLVEDEDPVRTLSRIALQSHGFKVIEADCGKSALLATEEYSKRIDMLLTDVVMPEMSGRELVEAIRLRRPDIKVLYMSGYTDDAVVQHGVSESTDAFIQKPFTPLGLARKVRGVLDEPQDRTPV